MPLLKDIFSRKSVEVQSCLRELNKIEDQYEGMSFDLVKPKVERLIKERKRTEYSIRVDKLIPSDLTLILISNMIQQLLLSGQYHVYRGVLGMIGQDLLTLLCFVIERLQQSSFYTLEEATEEKNWIKGQLKDIG